MSRKKKHNNAKKIAVFLLAFAIAGAAAYYVKQNYFAPKNTLKITPAQTTNQAEPSQKKPPLQPEEHVKVQKASVKVYFVKMNKNNEEEVVAVKRPVEMGKNRFETSIKALLKGPNAQEKSKGILSEIPSSTRLLYIRKRSDAMIINLSSDFSFGGGTSLITRLRQLINTAVLNAGGKKVYLYIDGEKTDVIGGDGIMIKQPLDIKDNLSQ